MSSQFSPSRTTSAGGTTKKAPRPCLKHAITSRSPPHQSTPSQPYAQSSPYTHSQSLTSLAASSNTTQHSHAHSHVHFPPSQSLSTTFPTHSKKTYDRRPLVVAPNMCALPARGCPGRTYAPGAYMPPEHATASGQSGDYTDMDINLDELLFSPPTQWVDTTLAMPNPAQRSLPALIPDHGISSSESEESDALMSPHAHGSVPYYGYGGDAQMGERQMDFLPHARSLEKGQGRERERERELRRKRRREREEEEKGRWKTGGLSSRSDDGSCLGGF